MNNLWKKRLNLYLKRMIKYYRYVFNDHFVIALLFLLGGISYTYSNFIKSLNVDLSYPWAKPVVIIVLLVMLQFGKVGTLIDEPDKVFLLPQEKGMREYLMKAQKRAWVSNSVIQIVVWIVLLPFILLRCPFKLSRKHNPVIKSGNFKSCPGKLILYPSL